MPSPERLVAGNRAAREPSMGSRAVQLYWLQRGMDCTAIPDVGSITKIRSGS
jgi:hypothetical protein